MPTPNLKLRDYQNRAPASTIAKWSDYDRLLGVAAVGAGKTIIAAALIEARRPQGRALFLAHRDELLDQAIDKFARTTGIVAAREQATSQPPYKLSSRLSLPVK